MPPTFAIRWTCSFGPSRPIAPTQFDGGETEAHLTGYFGRSGAVRGWSLKSSEYPCHLCNYSPLMRETLLNLCGSRGAVARELIPVFCEVLGGARN